MIDRFVKDIIGRDDPGFKWIPPIIKSGRLIIPGRYDGSQFTRLMYDAFCRLPKEKPREITFTEHIELYLRVLSELKVSNMPFVGPGARIIEFYPHLISLNKEIFSENTLFGDLFTEIIKRIREGAASPGFKKKLYRRIARSRENYRSARLYIESLFAAYSRLVIVRVDLIYRSEFAQRVTIEEARKDREHFLNNMRGNHLFSHLAGYLWKLEDGEQRGLHYHFIFFLDGSHKINASYYANEFGKYWAEIVTKGRGYFHNCHTSTASYKNYGIGVINHYESDKRANLTGSLLKYFTKTDQYFKVIGGRFFGHGEIAKRRISKNKKPIGRPRKYES